MSRDPGVPSGVTEELAPDGTLRAAINIRNELLVSSLATDGVPHGVAPDVAGEVARRLGVPVRWVLYESPAALADAAGEEAWDIGLLGAEPARAESIAFTQAYAEIPATYLVPAGSVLRAVSEVDRPGVRISVAGRTAYDLWLSRNIRHAELVRSPNPAAAYDLFIADELAALAGLTARLTGDAARTPGSRLLPGAFTSVQQAVGTPRSRGRAAAFLPGLVDSLVSSGFVARSIARHGVTGLSAAPPRPAGPPAPAGRRLEHPPGAGPGA
jgi:polar amino acid transport system substrate-binding protein